MNNYKNKLSYKKLRLIGKKYRTNIFIRNSPLRLLRKWVVQEIKKLSFRRRLHKSTPIFVCQMGKVGSRSIVESLEKNYSGVVLHGHIISRMGWESQYLLDWVNKGNPLKIIAPVREPISRNVSAFFHFIEGRLGQASDKSDLPIKELVDSFIDHRDDNEEPDNMAMMDHNLPLSWFDDNIKKYFGINVFSIPFPDSGHIVLTNNNTELLTFRIELHDSEKESLLREFINIPSFSLINTNVGSTKGYSKKYKEFKDLAVLPDSYIRKMRESKYFRHFYSENEIIQICDKWTNRSNSRSRST